MAKAGKTPRNVCLVDGSGFIFRAFHALPPLTRSDGTPVNAVLGFCNMIYKLARDQDCDAIAVLFDTARTTFRNDIYEDYKANRPEPPEELVPQFPLIRDATRAFGLPSIEIPGFEADDLIATYAKQAEARGNKVTIVSSDKDLMQLVTDQVVMLDPIKMREIGAAEVVEKFGVTPDKVIEVQALAGDSTDNVPGVPGIGIKTAAQLYTEYESLEMLLSLASRLENLENDAEKKLAERQKEIDAIAGTSVKIGSNAEVARVLIEKYSVKIASTDKKGNPTISTSELEDLVKGGNEFAQLVLRGRMLSKIKSNYATKIHENLESARISRDLVTLRDDVPVEDPLDSFGPLDPDSETLTTFLREQEFKSLLARLQAEFGWDADETAVEAPGAPAAPDEAEYELVTKIEDLERWVEAAVEAGRVAFDTETTSLDAMQAELAGFSLAIEPGRACYVPLGHRPPDGDLVGEVPEQIPLQQALGVLKPLLEDASVMKVGQNLKYDMLVLCRSPYNIDISPIDDTMLMSFVLAAGRHGHGMDELSKLHLDITPISIKQVIGTGKSQITFDRVPVERACDYAAEDADITLRLDHALKPQLVSEHMVSVYETMERPLAPVLVAMERRGIKLDRAELARLSRDFAERIQGYEEDIYKLAGRSFTIGSPKQLGEVLFDEMGLPGGKKGKSGSYATGAEILEDLAAQGHDLPARVLDWRQLTKLKSTYSDALAEQINPDTGRVHTSYAMAGAATGRLSSTDPNLQNIPVRTEEGRKIRRAFVPEKSYRLMSADYSQIELRLLAHVAEIDALQDAFKDGADIHAMTASQVFGIPEKGMDPLMRRRAKAINFGIIYGISPFGLARQLSIPQGDAKKYIDAYFERYPGIRTYMDETKAFARAHGYVETIFGRRCYLRGINERNPAHRGFAERQAINAPLQGSAADIIKRAMIRMQPALDDAKLSARMLLQVHDELVFEVPEKEIDKTTKVVKRVMEEATYPLIELAVPLTVDTGVGDNWEEAH